MGLCASAPESADLLENTFFDAVLKNDHKLNDLARMFVAEEVKQGETILTEGEKIQPKHCFFRFVKLGAVSLWKGNKKVCIKRPGESVSFHVHTFLAINDERDPKITNQFDLRGEEDSTIYKISYDNLKAFVERLRIPGTKQSMYNFLGLDHLHTLEPLREVLTKERLPNRSTTLITAFLKKKHLLPVLFDGRKYDLESIYGQGDDNTKFYVVASSQSVQEQTLQGLEVIPKGPPKTQGASFNELACVLEFPCESSLNSLDFNTIVLELRRENYLLAHKALSNELLLEELSLELTARKLQTFRVPFFEVVPADKFMMLASLCETVTKGRNEIIFSKGDIGDSFYIVAFGEVGIEIVNEGKKEIVAKLNPGRYFGEIALMKKDTLRTATVLSTANKTVLFRITEGNFKMFFREAPEAVADFEVRLAGANVELKSILYHEFSQSRLRKFMELERSVENLEFWNECRQFESEAKTFFGLAWNAVSYYIAGKEVNDAIADHAVDEKGCYRCRPEDFTAPNVPAEGKGALEGLCASCTGIHKLKLQIAKEMDTKAFVEAEARWRQELTYDCDDEKRVSVPQLHRYLRERMHIVPTTVETPMPDPADFVGIPELNSEILLHVFDNLDVDFLDGVTMGEAVRFLQVMFVASKLTCVHLRKKAKDIFIFYIQSDAEKMLNLKHDVKMDIFNIINKKQPVTLKIFHHAQSHIATLLGRDTFVRWKASREFQKFLDDFKSYDMGQMAEIERKLRDAQDAIGSHRRHESIGSSLSRQKSQLLKQPAAAAAQAPSQASVATVAEAPISGLSEKTEGGPRG
jgi:CRP-like cAMP-binding protein